ncbi:MAG: hypothetical protein L6V83_07510 [Christensenella sp.]|nr:MAG: hypothetical protein L6V83_07510 [Christensenella sp.]
MLLIRFCQKSQKNSTQGVESRVRSSFQSRHLKIGVSTEQLIGEILDLTEEKRKIVNLRFIVKKALDKMVDADREILVERIVQKKTFQEIADSHKIALRTAFRRIANAEEDFANNLRRCGYTEDWLDKEYGNDKYIAPIHERIKQDKYFVAKNL